VGRPGPLQFYRPPFRYFPNPDSAYLLAYLTAPTPPDVVVVTAKAPSFASGDHPSLWPEPTEVLRYWSICVNVGVGTSPVVVNPLQGAPTDLGCRADESTTIDNKGDYTYVVGTEAQRAAIERIPGVTFLPLSSAQPTALHLLVLRYTLVSPNFGSSPQNVSQTSNPSAAAAAMGPYYPRARVCSLNTLAAEAGQVCQ
jgi:hypothetical protein